MNLILLGPPGAGKGTQAVKISLKYGIPHISTGDIFRETAQSGSELGQRLKSYMSKGELVPDSLVVDIVKVRLSKPDAQKGFVLDGFPRTVPQAKALGEALSADSKKLDRVLCIIVDNQELIKRLSSRRICGSCGASFNLISNPPKKADVCDICGAKLVARQDDDANVISARLRVYDEQTSPLIAYYSNINLLSKVDGSKSVEEVFKDLCAAIESR
jgi:adenylate kinase